MENDLAIFLVALIQHPVRLATSVSLCPWDVVNDNGG